MGDYKREPIVFCGGCNLSLDSCLCKRISVRFHGQVIGYTHASNDIDVFGEVFMRVYTGADTHAATEDIGNGQPIVTIEPISVENVSIDRSALMDALGLPKDPPNE